MTLHSLEEALADSAALAELVKRGGVTLSQAKALLGALADLPAVQAIRICETARRDAVRQTNRKTRTGR